MFETKEYVSISIVHVGFAVLYKIGPQGYDDCEFIYKCIYVQDKPSGYMQLCQSRAAVCEVWGEMYIKES